jgi:hypothetical protein
MSADERIGTVISSRCYRSADHRLHHPQHQQVSTPFNRQDTVKHLTLPLGTRVSCEMRKLGLKYCCCYRPSGRQALSVSMSSQLVLAGDRHVLLWPTTRWCDHLCYALSVSGSAMMSRDMIAVKSYASTDQTVRPYLTTSLNYARLGWWCTCSDLTRGCVQGKPLESSSCH